MVTGEFTNRTETAATAFKPKLWTYAVASPASKYQEVPFSVGTDLSVWGCDTPELDDANSNRSLIP